jgi:hypothetical protein
MVQSIIELDERRDRVLNVVKAKHGLKNKSDAVRTIIDAYEQQFLEPELRPEYIERLKRVEKGKFKKFSTIDDLRKEIEHV